MSIPLCFPMPVTVAAESRIELFPQGEYSAYANVEYRIGTPAVRFVVKRNVIEAQPDSFFAKQLEHQAVMGGGAVHVENTTTVVTLDDPTYCPRLFPIVFNYLNQTFVNPTTAKIATDGLSKEDIEAVRELAKGFLCIKDRTSFLFIVQSPLFHAGIIDFTVNSRLSDDDDTRRNKRAKTSPPTSFITDDRVMHCSIHGVVVTIYLRDIPTSAPWAKSLIGDQVLAMLRKRPRERSRQGTAPIVCLRRRNASSACHRRRPHAVPVSH